MKEATFTLVAFLAINLLFSQNPQAFKYQAIVRNNTGHVLANTEVSFQISILQGSAVGANVYTETHAEMTNEFGLVNLEIGNGIVTAGVFTAIDWGNDLYFLQIEMDDTGGSTYQLMGTSQLLSVPYALYAKTAENVDNINISGLFYYLDKDSDGFGDNLRPIWVPESVTPPVGFIDVMNDCNDDDDTIYPGADEICGDGIDQDCDGSDLTCSPEDTDDDGDGYTENQGDCDDANVNIYPGAVEVCDCIDNDCDGEVDEGEVCDDLIVSSQNTPVLIPDNLPSGTTDIITVPDAVIAACIIVSVDISNSDLSSLWIGLQGPDGSEYVLWDGSAGGTELVTSYPEPTPTVSGDLSEWMGTNPQGQWTLRVIDTGFLNNGYDGQINSWTISIRH